MDYTHMYIWIQYTHVHTCIHVCTGLVDCICMCDYCMCVLNQLNQLNLITNYNFNTAVFFYC